MFARTRISTDAANQTRTRRGLNIYRILCVRGCLRAYLDGGQVKVHHVLVGWRQGWQRHGRRVTRRWPQAGSRWPEHGPGSTGAGGQLGVHITKQICNRGNLIYNRIEFNQWVHFKFSKSPPSLACWSEFILGLKSVNLLPLNSQRRQNCKLIENWTLDLKWQSSHSIDTFCNGNCLCDYVKMTSHILVKWPVVRGWFVTS